MNETATFWDHLDELRSVIIRSLVATVLFGTVAFCLKDWLFQIVLGPCQADFPVYRLIGAEPFQLHLINTELTEQFSAHLRMSVYVGLLLASPYILYELFRFVSPGLYANERRAGLWVVCSAYVMFVLGTVLNYLVMLPMTVRFLGTYQVSADVDNMLTLRSYVDTFIMMSLALGAVFELPVVCVILGRLGLIDAGIMRRYRRHAIVAILVVAAIITPTTDVLSLLVVSLPIWLLYEISIFLLRKKTKN